MKHLSILTITALALSLTACSNSTPDAETLLPSDISTMNFAELSATKEYQDWLGENCSETTIARDLENLGVFTIEAGSSGDKKAILESRAKRLNEASSSFTSAKALVEEVLTWDQYYDQKFDPGTGTEESSSINYAWLNPTAGAESVIIQAFAESFSVLSSGSTPLPSATQELVDDWVKACGIQVKIDAFFSSNSTYIDAIDKWKSTFADHYSSEGYKSFSDSGLSFLTKIVTKGTQISVSVVHFNYECSIDGLSISAPGKPDQDGLTGPEFRDSTYVGNVGAFEEFTEAFEADSSTAYELNKATVDSINCN